MLHRTNAYIKYLEEYISVRNQRGFTESKKVYENIVWFTFIIKSVYLKLNT